MLLGPQEFLRLHGAVDHEDDEVGAEDDQITENHDPHVAIARGVDGGIRLGGVARRCGGRIGLRRGLLCVCHVVSQSKGGSSTGWSSLAFIRKTITQLSQKPKTTVPIQKEIDPFQANGPALDTNTGTARISVTICQTDTYASHFGKI